MEYGIGSHQLLGSDQGFRQIWTQNSPGIEDASESGDFFGIILATGDFDGDGFDDLAIAAPYEDHELCFGPACEVTEEHGVVHVLYGSEEGLTSIGSQLLSQISTGGLEGDLEAEDRFGLTLAAGDFDFDGHDDLAIGVPFESIFTDGSEHEDAGALHVVYGSAAGLDTGRSLFWHLDTPGVPGEVGPVSHYALGLAAAPFQQKLDEAGPDDLIVGYPFHFQRRGAIHHFKGSVLGLLNQNVQEFTLDTAGIPGNAAVGDRFGEVLAVGDLNADRFADLAVAAAYKDTGGVENSGAVYVFLSDGTAGLGTGDVSIWSQASTGVLGDADPSELFGLGLCIGDFDRDGFDDLAIGTPYEVSETTEVAGAVNVLRGGLLGLTSAGNQFFNDHDVRGGSVEGNSFGAGLAFGRFDDRGPALVIGAPRVARARTDPDGYVHSAGAVHIVTAADFDDSFESGELSSWSQTRP